MMENVIVLIKVNVLISVLYLMYIALLRRDTFFLWRRMALLSFYLMASIQFVAASNMFHLPSAVSGTIDSGVREMWLDVVEVTSAAGVRVDSFDWNTLFIYIWIGVTSLLVLRFLFQLLVIVKFVLTSKTECIEGRNVKLIDLDEGPFSFFGWVFINRSLLDDKCLHEILSHEEAHVRQMHSVDVILSEICCIVFWFNPFVWLLKREVRINLEYLADEAVIANGYDSRDYQYHLLMFTIQRSVATLTNNFNVLPLKERIIMMNKKRTKKAGMLKYLLLLPVSILLFMMSSVTVSAQVKKSIVHEDGSVTVKYEGKDVLVKESGSDVYQVTEEMPEFPGGMKALMDYFSANVKYPEAAKKAGISGRVTTQFVVGEDGVIRDVKVLRGVSPELDAEAIRVMSSMPKWNPGKQDGKAVAVRYTVPVTFKDQ